MEKQRRVGRGTLSEILGRDPEGMALNIDKFMRSIGLYRGAKETWESGTIDKEVEEIF